VQDSWLYLLYKLSYKQLFCVRSSGAICSDAHEDLTGTDAQWIRSCSAYSEPMMADWDVLGQRVKGLDICLPPLTGKPWPAAVYNLKWRVLTGNDTRWHSASTAAHCPNERTLDPAVCSYNKPIYAQTAALTAFTHDVQPRTRRVGLFTWRTILPNFFPMRFETVNAFLKSVGPKTRRWVAVWDQFLIQK